MANPEDRGGGHSEHVRREGSGVDGRRVVVEGDQSSESESNFERTMGRFARLFTRAARGQPAVETRERSIIERAKNIGIEKFKGDGDPNEIGRASCRERV